MQEIEDNEEQPVVVVKKRRRKRKKNTDLSGIPTTEEMPVAPEAPKDETIIGKGWHKTKPVVQKVWRVFLPRKNGKENIFQYVLRQLVLSDSTGNPSWTVTILAFVMALVGVIALYEIKIALSEVLTYHPQTGMIIGKRLQGFSSEFIYLLIVLSAVITTFFNSREKRRFGPNGKCTTNGTPPGTPQESAPEGSLLDKAMDTIKRLKGGK
jgi:hypothetical protein